MYSIMYLLSVLLLGAPAIVNAGSYVENLRMLLANSSSYSLYCSTGCNTISDKPECDNYKSNIIADGLQKFSDPPDQTDLLAFVIKDEGFCKIFDFDASKISMEKGAVFLFTHIWCAFECPLRSYDETGSTFCRYFRQEPMRTRVKDATGIEVAHMEHATLCPPAIINDYKFQSIRQSPQIRHWCDRECTKDECLYEFVGILKLLPSWYDQKKVETIVLPLLCADLLPAPKIENNNHTLDLIKSNAFHYWCELGCHDYLNSSRNCHFLFLYFGLKYNEETPSEINTGLAKTLSSTPMCEMVIFEKKLLTTFPHFSTTWCGVKCGPSTLPSDHPLECIALKKNVIRRIEGSTSEQFDMAVNNIICSN